jgi:N-acyl homoserine lactone hydrolase
LQQGISTSPDTLLRVWTRLDAMLKDTPLVEVIEAARVTALPDFHPEAGPTFAGFPVNAFVIHHPAGPIIVDTGIGTGNEHIDDWYRPIVCDLRAELAQRDIDPDSGLTIVNTHLHFDHCGQNQNFPSASIYAQQAEIDLLASDAHYTVAAWANMPLNRSTIIDGDQEIADGVSVLHTPGHTPGHQSVVIRSRNETIVIAGQCLWTASDWETSNVRPTNLHDDTCAKQAADSIAKLKALRPTRIHLSHDQHVIIGATNA